MIKETYMLGNKQRESYGIAAYDDTDAGGVYIMASVKDLTGDRSEVEALVAQWNREQLSLIHFDDGIEDFFAARSFGTDETVPAVIEQGCKVEVCCSEQCT